MYIWTPHKQHVYKLSFQSENVKKKAERSLHVGATIKTSHICSYVIFFHEFLNDFEVKNQISSIKRIELSLKYKLFQWFHYLLFTVLSLSFDWKIHFNLGFILKSFRCSKGDVWRVLLTALQNEPTKSWVMKLRKIVTR